MRLIRLKKLPTLGSVLFLALFLCSTANANYYRYENNEGQIVLDHTIPAEFVPKGYDIVNNRGRLIRRVPPKKTTTQNAGNPAPAAQRQTAAELREDSILLSSYSSIKEIEAHRDRKIEEMEKQTTFVGLEESNLRKTYNAVKAQAAEYERREEKVPQMITKRLAQYEEALARLTEQLDVQKVDLEAEKAAFRDRIARFREIKGLPPEPEQPANDAESLGAESMDATNEQSNVLP